MILKSELEKVIETQKNNLLARGKGLMRENLEEFKEISSYALIISGIRRCGKSTLLYQLLATRHPDSIYLNFEDTRIYGFSINDFAKLDEILSNQESKTLFLDEIQIVKDWERYIRQKLDENYNIIITGSNASLLSKELGTVLTGRHITKELFPFSFLEFCTFNRLSITSESLEKYLISGGFPEYVKQGIDDILYQLLDDIIIKDIAVRYAVRDIKGLQRLAKYLITNIGKLITANKLKTYFNISATSTMMEYLSHLEMAYLFFFIPKFSYSQKQQNVNPRKVYSIDTGLIKVNSTSFTEDKGRIFENMIFLHLRRNFKEIYYFSNKGECDFIVVDKGNIKLILQVCFELNSGNMQRELNGLYEALGFFDRPEGLIITLNQNDQFKKDNKVVDVIDASTFLQMDINQ